MTESKFSGLIEEMEARAREASVAEQEFDREVARRRAEVSEARAFAWRRVSLMRALIGELGRHEGEEDALAAGRIRFFRELGWSGATENQQQVAEHFEPVLVAIREVIDGSQADAGVVAAAFEAFENWYLETRQASFLTLMQREIVELPLVEV